MEAAGLRSRVLVESDPHSEWVHGDKFDTLIVDVTGFTKDQLKIQVDPSGSLRISGESAVNGGQQWFHKRFDLPGGCDASEIKVQLDKGMLHVLVPHPSDAAATGDGEQYAVEPPHPSDAAATSDGEQYAVEPYGDALQEEEDGAVRSGGHTAAWQDHGHPEWQLAKSLSKHRHAVLNVVVAVVLLWLVAFAKHQHVLLNVVLALVLLWLVAFAKNEPSCGQIKNE